MNAQPKDQPRFTFDTQELNKIERSYSELNLSDYQRKTTRAIAAIHATNLGISEVAVRGFINFATMDWQKESKLLAEEYYTLNKEEQVAALMRIAEHFYTRVSKIVPESQHRALKKSIMEAHVAALKSYNL